MFPPGTKLLTAAAVFVAGAAVAVTISACSTARLARRAAKSVGRDGQATPPLDPAQDAKKARPGQADTTLTSAGRGRSTCKLGLAFAWLPGDVAAEAMLIVADRGLSTRDAARQLGDLGVPVSHQTVNRHRNRVLPSPRQAGIREQCGCRVDFDPGG